MSSSFAAGLTSPRGSTPRRTYGALAPPAFALSPAPYVSPGAAGADDPYEPSSLGEDPRRRAAASRPRAARPRRAFKARERRSVGEDYAGTERDAPDRVRAPSSVVHEGTLAAFVAAEDDGFEDEPLVIETVTEIDLSDHSLHQSLDDDASDDDAERLSPAHADLSYASDPRDEAGLVTPPPPDLV